MKNIGKYCVVLTENVVQVCTKNNRCVTAEYDSSSNAKQVYKRIDTVGQAERFVRVQRLSSNMMEHDGW